MFAPDLTEYAFVEVSFADAKLWEESIKLFVKLFVFAPLFKAQKSMS